MNLLPKLKSRHSKAILALITANIIWGAASPIFKFSLENIPPFTLAYFRFLGASLLLLPFAFKPGYPAIEKKDLGKIVLLSVLGITVNIIFFFFGLTYAPSINSPVIASGGPVFIYLISIFLLKEKAHRRVLAGLVVSLLGIIAIVGQPLFDGGLKGEVIGNIFFVLAMLGAVGHAIVSKEILPKYKAVTVTFWSFVIGTLTFLPFFITEMVRFHPLLGLDYRGITGLIYGIFLSSAAAYLLFEWGMKEIEAQEAGLFYYVDPLAAIIIAIPLLGETLSPVFITGSLLVFVGIFIAEGRFHWHPFWKLKSQ